VRHSIVVAVALALSARGVVAQEADTSARVGQDSIVERAKQLVQSGKDAEGRRLLDSLVTATPTDSARFAEALFWHGAFAGTAADAERDYRRLLIEAPLSPRAEDALLRLAQLEQARGDRRGASDHLQRFLLSYPQSPARPRVSVQLVRLLFDQGPQQLARACDVLSSARAEVPATNVELRNQLDAQAPRCAYVETQAPPVPVADSTPARVPAPAPAATVPDTLKRPVTLPVAPAVVSTRPTTPSAAPPAGLPAPSPAAASAAAYYSVQLAAYDSQESATRMVQQLSGRGIDARVDGAVAPYRVRVGKFSTRAEAAKAAGDLKTKGHSGFITLVGPTPK
jgi:cell division septation protein DedD